MNRTSFVALLVTAGASTAAVAPAATRPAKERAAVAPAATRPAEERAAAAATRTVAVRDNVFAPKRLTARRGDLLVFRWQGDNPHNVRATTRRAGIRGAVRTSGRYRVRLRRAGSFRIVCDIHPGMEMRLRVRR